MHKIDFYFDFLSPFSFFAWKNIQAGKLKAEYQINYYPVLLGNLLNHHELKGPGEITPKREYLFRSCLRYAAAQNIKFTVPKSHPFNPLYALRLATKECAGHDQVKVIDCLWRAGWEEGIELGDPDALTKALNDQGLPAATLMEKTYDKAIKNAVKQNTENAIERGAFGVPTFIVSNDELFWGNDSLPDLEKYLNGKDLLERKLYADILQKTPRTGVQKIDI